MVLLLQYLSYLNALLSASKGVADESKGVD